MPVLQSLAQARSNLEAARVPRVHAETAIKQNPGLISILDEMVTPHLGELSGADRAHDGGGALRRQARRSGLGGLAAYLRGPAAPPPPAC